MLNSAWAQKYFLCPITNKHLNESWTSFLRVASQGLYCPFLKNFAAIIPNPTDRPLVFEDGVKSPLTNKKKEQIIWILAFLMQRLLFLVLNYIHVNCYQYYPK